MLRFGQHDRRSLLEQNHDMSVQLDSLELFQTVGRDMYLTGLVSSHTGTLSLRSDEHLLISRRDAMLGQLTASDLIELPVEGEYPDTAPRDAIAHSAIYRYTGASAAIYARPPTTMALTLVEDRLSPANGEGEDIFGTVPVAISQRPMGSPELADLIGQMLKESRVVSVRGHGVFAWGADLADALHMVSLLEEMCRIAHVFRTLSREEQQPAFLARSERQPLPGASRSRGDGAASRMAPRHPFPHRPSGSRRPDGGRRGRLDDSRGPGGPYRP